MCIREDEEEKKKSFFLICVCVCVCVQRRGKKKLFRTTTPKGWPLFIFFFFFFFFVFVLLGEVLNKAANGLVVELSVYGECCSLLASQSIHGRVGTILVVRGVDLDLGVVGPLDVDLEVITSKGLVVVVLVAGLHSETEHSKSRVVRVCALLAVNVEWSILDGLALVGDVDVIIASLLRVEGHIIGAITVVLDLGVYRAMGSVNVNVEVVTTVISGVAVLVNSMNGEHARLIVNQTVKGRTISP